MLKRNFTFSAHENDRKGHAYLKKASDKMVITPIIFKSINQIIFLFCFVYIHSIDQIEHEINVLIVSFFIF